MNYEDPKLPLEDLLKPISPKIINEEIFVSDYTRVKLWWDVSDAAWTFPSCFRGPDEKTRVFCHRANGRHVFHRA